METEEKTLKLEILKQAAEDGLIYVTFSEYEGKPFAIFQFWNDVYKAIGIINGFYGRKTEVHIPQGKTVASYLEEIKAASHLDPGNYHYRSLIDSLTAELLYAQYLAAYHIDPIKLDDVIEDWGFAYEYNTCCECYKVVRTSPDCHFWTPPLFIDSEGYVCDNCVSTGRFNDYVLENYKNECKNIPDSFDLDDLGLVKVNEDSYQNGFHHGMDDSPEPIINALNEKGIDVWFKVEPSQFYLDFDVYVQKAHLKSAQAILKSTDTYQGYSNAENAERALKSGSIQADMLKGEGVRIVTCDISTGTSSAKLVSPEEFIKGVK